MFVEVRGQCIRYTVARYQIFFSHNADDRYGGDDRNVYPTTGATSNVSPFGKASLAIWIRRVYVNLPNCRLVMNDNEETRSSNSSCKSV